MRSRPANTRPKHSVVTTRPPANEHRDQITAKLAAIDVELLIEALDSHLYWQISDEHYRSHGYVLDPITDDVDQRRAADACERLRSSLVQLIWPEAKSRSLEP